MGTLSEAGRDCGLIELLSYQPLHRGIGRSIPATPRGRYRAVELADSACPVDDSSRREEAGVAAFGRALARGSPAASPDRGDRCRRAPPSAESSQRPMPARDRPRASRSSRAPSGRSCSSPSRSMPSFLMPLTAGRSPRHPPRAPRRPHAHCRLRRHQFFPRRLDHRAGVFCERSRRCCRLGARSASAGSRSFAGSLPLFAPASLRAIWPSAFTGPSRR